jgi:hypothetical protein
MWYSKSGSKPAATQTVRMQRYEYKVVPSPRRGTKAKGAKTTGDKFAAALTELMNAEAREGWEYLRAESLPAEEKPGMLRSTVEVYQSMLVFRRELAPATPAPAPAPVATVPPLSAARPAEVLHAEPSQRAEPQVTVPRPHIEPVLTLGAENVVPELGPARKD